MPTRRRRENTTTEAPRWFDKERYPAAARRLNSTGWLYQISARLALGAYRKDREVDADMPWHQPHSWAHAGEQLWQGIMEQGVLPLSDDGSIGTIDP